jgi:DNA modification methylase
VIGKNDLELLLDGIHNEAPVSGLTHGFYRYPARFSPLFTRAAIEAFTRPGDTVYDPFMGGGTTLVEAMALGRKAIGTDINSLAVFLAEAKTSLLSSRQLTAVGSWIERIVPKMSVWSPVQRARDWADLGYQRNINSRATWRIRKIVEIALSATGALKTAEEQRFARCIVLRTAQWALDCRKEIPSVDAFRNRFRSNASEMIIGAADYARAVRRVRSNVDGHGNSQPLCLHRSVVGVESEQALVQHRPIRLVLTSPPYPGVHVLYHRWQVQGRRETPAPFWIAASLDGNGASYYTFGDRKEQQLNSYFNNALASFESIARIADENTLVVQMVAFSEPEWQLNRYASMMDNAGFREIKFPQIANAPDGRVWRSVPNRKWYASQRGTTPSSSEVVLFHALR